MELDKFHLAQTSGNQTAVSACNNPTLSGFSFQNLTAQSMV